MLSWITSTLFNKDPIYKKYGWVRDIPDFRDKYKGFSEFNSHQKQIVDLRYKCPKVFNQGSLASCTANALAAAFEFDIIRRHGGSFIPSRLFIYYNERCMEGTTKYDSGAKIRDGIKSINKQGIIPEDIWPYDVSKFTREPPEELYTIAHKYKSIKYSRICQDINHIKEALSSGFPIVFGFSVYDSFENTEVSSTGCMKMPQPIEKLLGGHTVLAVGYSEKDKVIIVRNSWGEEWGDKGYFYMPYDYITDIDLASDLWIIEQVHHHKVIIPYSNISF